ncbi:hypothetical protein AVEN_147470-1, partial [Araneus ventricosus]
TKSTDQGPANDESNCENESEASVKRLSEKTKSTVSLPEETSTSHEMTCLTDNHDPNDAEKVVIPADGPPPIMMKRSLNFEADLRLINEKFGEIRTKKTGIFTKLLPETDDTHQEIIAFLTANNLEYLTPKRIKVVITGLPCDMRTQQIEEALIERDLDVKKVVQLTEYLTGKPLSLFQVVLPNSERNKNIFNLTDLLNLNISVERIGEGRLRIRTIKCGIEHSQEKGTVKSEADVSKCVNCGETGKDVSWHSDR